MNKYLYLLGISLFCLLGCTGNKQVPTDMFQGDEEKVVLVGIKGAAWNPYGYDYGSKVLIVETLDKTTWTSTKKKITLDSKRRAVDVKTDPYGRLWAEEYYYDSWLDRIAKHNEQSTITIYNTKGKKIKEFPAGCGYDVIFIEMIGYYRCDDAIDVIDVDTLEVTKTISLDITEDQYSFDLELVQEQFIVTVGDRSLKFPYYDQLISIDAITHEEIGRTAFSFILQDTVSDPLIPTLFSYGDEREILYVQRGNFHNEEPTPTDVRSQKVGFLDFSASQSEQITTIPNPEIPQKFFIEGDVLHSRIWKLSEKYPERYSYYWQQQNLQTYAIQETEIAVRKWLIKELIEQGGEQYMFGEFPPDALANGEPILDIDEYAQTQDVPTTTGVFKLTEDGSIELVWESSLLWGEIKEYNTID